MKILVIDDEPVVLNSCRKVLEEDGFDVYLVPSADEALKAMERGRIDFSARRCQDAQARWDISYAKG